MSDKLERMDVPRFIPHREDGEITFEPIPHEAESVYSETVFEQELSAIFSKIVDPKNEKYVDFLLRQCGEAIGSYIARQPEVARRKDVVYGLALFQGFLEKIILKHGMKIKHHFRNTSFMQGIESGASSLSRHQQQEADVDFHPLHPERIPEKITGAISVVEYIHQLEEDPRVIFVGSDVFLDTKYAIDLIVGYSNDPSARPVTIDEVKIVQVKTKHPDPDTLRTICGKHHAYIDSVRGVEIDTVVAVLDEPELEPRDVEVDVLTDLMKFYTRLADPKEGLLVRMKKPVTWQSIVDVADSFSCDPVLFYVQLLTINDNRIRHLLPFRQGKLKELQHEVSGMSVPQSVLSTYTRMSVDIPTPSLMHAPVIRSVVVSGGRAAEQFMV